EIYPYASAYYRIILIGLPFLAFSMMSNNVIRAEGKAKVAMMTMVIPGILNIGLDPIFILTLDMGIEGAATATVIAYFCSASFAAWFFLSGRSSVVLRASYLRLDPGIVRETFAIGITTFARQATASLLSIAANNMLFRHGGENAITSFTIIQRVLMIAFVPLFGLVQGFLPISGYNYGAGKFARLKEVTIKSMAYGVFISTILFVLIISFANSIVQVFTTDAELINATVRPLRIVFFATPVIGIQLVGAAYFQALGRAIPALILTLMRQAIFLIPLVLILPRFFELDGIWYAFPIAELLAMLFTSAYMWPQWNWLNNKIEH
ncbi:MAG: putative MATE family efflux protein, partial [Limisphaerales bacterium]